MYKRYKQGINEVGNVVERSLSNISLVDLKQDKAPVPDDSPPKPQYNPEIIQTVEKCWEQIGSQCEKYGNQTKDRSIVTGEGWRTVRVFVSSTFTDFFCEREALVKKVFPELREWCRERMLYLIDCDLRWGVPKDTVTADTIAICLEELDRCIEETDEQPFFLNLTGERYGWIPGLEEIPEEMRQKYGWVPNTSITFMEILHGAYRLQNRNALFMFRDGSIIDDIPEEHRPRFKDTDPLQALHLQQQKSNLRKRFPNQVHDYTCSVDGLVQNYGKQMVNIGGLDDFCTDVLEFFKAAIERTFPNHKETQQFESRVLQENANQRKFMEEISGKMCGRKAEVEHLLQYLQGHTADLKEGELSSTSAFVRDPEFWKDYLAFENNILFLSGQSGHGKSTLLAHITQQCVKENRMRVFYHFCGSTGASQSDSLLQQRLIAFLKQDYSQEYLESLYYADDTKLKELLRDEVLALKDKTSENSTVIILDALDQLSSSESVQHINWLPPKLPASIRCIVSSAPRPVTIHRIQEHPHYQIQLEDLHTEDAQDIVRSFLLRYGKHLDTEQLKMITDSKCSESPLWLYLVCEELRIYGDFRTLTAQVKAVTSTFDGMMEAILQRLVSEDKLGFLQKALCLLACSLGVITSLDLQRMLGDISAKESLAPMIWGHIRRSLSAYLRVTGYNEQITFVHEKIRETVYKTVVKTEGQKWHTALADYIEYWSEDHMQRMEALPYHLQRARLGKRLVHFVREIPESAKLPSFRRSSLLNECRCRNLADPVIKGVAPVYICTFCRHNRAVYFPRGFHSNEQMCVVCGSQVFHSMFSTQANVCHFHGVHQLMPRCFLCDKVLGEKMMIFGKLCQHCGFGNDRKRCAALDMHL